MSKPDTPLVRMADIPAAIGLLSRLPVHTDNNRGAASAWAFPLVGLIIGSISAATGWVLLAAGLPASLTAGLTLAFMIITTGAMHEDGLADAVDGLWGGWDKTRRLEIMKDSHIGTYGVIALIFSLILRWVALTAITEAGLLSITLIAIATLSRAPMVAMMALMPNARGSGLSASVGRVGTRTAVLALGIGISVTIMLLGWSSIKALIVTLVASIFCAQIAIRKIGGQTGDILGATQQITEIATLLALATAIA